MRARGFRDPSTPTTAPLPSDETAWELILENGTGQAERELMGLRSYGIKPMNKFFLWANAGPSDE